MHLHPALITLLNVVLLFIATYYVGRARGEYSVKAPATTGPEGFERAFRAHMNTLEATVTFLPSLWLAAQFNTFSPIYVAILGYLWLLGRTWYLFGYLKAPNKRGGGFIVSTLALLGMVLLAAWGVIRQLLA